jgi:hypothetical protein
MKTETINQIKKYISENQNRHGYWNGSQFECLGQIDWYTECLDYVDTETAEDVVDAITDSIHESCDVVYVSRAYHYVGEYLDNAQQICDEYEISKPFDNLELVATLILQQNMVDEIQTMYTEIDAIVDEFENQ